MRMEDFRGNGGSDGLYDACHAPSREAKAASVLSSRLYRRLSRRHPPRRLFATISVKMPMTASLLISSRS